MQNEIIDKILEKYGTCDSYIDHGVIEGIRVRNHSAFSTYFSRPNLFRFEWKGDDNFWLVLSYKNGETQCKTAFHETEPTVNATEEINKIGGLTGSATLFIFKMLFPEEDGIDFNLSEYKDFEEKLDNTDSNCGRLFEADSKSGMNKERWLISNDPLRILSREAIFNSSEYQAKLNASNYFAESDPDYSRLLKLEAQELKDTGTIYKINYLGVAFDSMTDCIREEKFA